VTLTGGYSGDKGEAHALSVVNSGQTTPDGIGVTVNASTRFIATVGADRDAATKNGTAIAEDAGVLQQADDGLGTYTDVPWAASLYTITTTGSDPQKSYRARGTGP
jgi:hypothetical protein